MFNQEALKTLLNNTPIGYAFFNISTNNSTFSFHFADMNPAFSKITEINKDFIGKSLDEISLDNDLIQEFSNLLHSIVPNGKDGHISKCFNSGGKCLYIHSFTANAHGAIIQVLDRTEEELLRKELASRAKDLEFISYHDKLTGLYNRSFFEEEMKRLDTDRNLPISIIMGDTNGLKLINDIFGHAAGDKLIIATADILIKSCRQGDIVARWGGDEFVILLPKTSSKSALEVINRIKSNFKTDSFDSDYLNISLGYSVKKHNSISLFDALREAENNMYKNKSIEGHQVRKLIIGALVDHLYEGDTEVKNHMDRLKEYARQLGTSLKLAKDDISKLNLICEMHDIGNVSIDKEILSKIGALSQDDWEEIKKHPEVGYRIAKSIPELSDVANYILYHHEKWDGTGYPHNLKGEDIPLLSRLFTVIDVYDSMTQDKAYRKAYSKELTISYLKENAGTQFDPTIVDVFIEKVLN